VRLEEHIVVVLGPAELAALAFERHHLVVDVRDLVLDLCLQVFVRVQPLVFDLEFDLVLRRNVLDTAVRVQLQVELALLLLVQNRGERGDFLVILLEFVREHFVLRPVNVFEFVRTHVDVVLQLFAVVFVVVVRDLFVQLGEVRVVDGLHVLADVGYDARSVGVQARVELVELLLDVGREVVQFGEFGFAFLEVHEGHWVLNIVVDFVDVDFGFVVF